MGFPKKNRFVFQKLFASLWGIFLWSQYIEILSKKEQEMDTLAILIESGLVETDRIIDHGAESNTSDHSGSVENPFLDHR